MKAVTQAALLEAKERRQLLGWWLPLAAAGGLGVVGFVLRLHWPFWVICYGMLFIFHRYHRWKLQLAFAGEASWCFGTLGSTREVSRGHRQSHGLMYPVYLRQCERWYVSGLGGSPESVGELLFWVDGSVLVRLVEGERVGFLQVGQEAVVVAWRAGQLLVSSPLRLEPEWAQQVVVVAGDKPKGEVID